MKEERTAHPKSCRGCRHDVRVESRWTGVEVQRISGWCGHGLAWGSGCPQYAETVHRPRRGHDLVKG